jgi:hypothetical protein
VRWRSLAGCAPSSQLCRLAAYLPGLCYDWQHCTTPSRPRAPLNHVCLWRAVAVLCAHGYGRQASYYCAVTCNSYVVAGRSDAIHARNAAEAVRALEAMFRHKAGPFVACGRSCVPMAASGSCCMLGLSLFHG